VLAYVNVLLMSNPRVMYAMSEDGVLPKLFGKRTERREVLFASLTSFAAVCVLVVFWAKNFETILSFSIFLDCFGMALSAGSIFILRKRMIKPEGATIYSMKLFPFQPLVFITAYCLVGISIMVNKPLTALTGLGVLAAFICIYFLTRKK